VATDDREAHPEGVGGWQGIRTPVRCQRPARPDQDVRTSRSGGCTAPSGPRGPGSMLFGYNDLQGGFEGSGTSGSGPAEEAGTLQHPGQRCVEALRVPLIILPLLSQTP